MAMRVRLYRAAHGPDIFRLEICECVYTWSCNLCVAASTSSRKKGMDIRTFRSFQVREKQHPEVFDSSSSECLGKVQEQSGLSHPHLNVFGLFGGRCLFSVRVDSEPVCSLAAERPLGFSYGAYQSEAAKVVKRPKWMVARICSSNSQSLLTTGSQHRYGGPRLIHDLESFCANGQLNNALDVLLRLDEQELMLSMATYGSILKVCAKKKALPQAKQVHAILIKHGLDSTRFLGEYMVSTLVHCGDLEGAIQVFLKLSCRTAFSWTALIFGYAMAGHAQKTLQMYRCMQEEGLAPNKYTFTSLLRACGNLSDLDSARYFHAEAIKYCCASSLSVVRSLIDMYAKCKSIVDARYVFDVFSGRDVVSWNLMLASYVQQGQAESALVLHAQMVEQRLSPNDRTFVSLIQACGILADKDDADQVTKLEYLKKGREIHDDARRRGFDDDVFVGSALVSMYSKCGSIADARNVFDGLSRKNVVSWTAMLASYVQQVDAERVLELYKQMLEAGISPNDRTYVCAIQACGMLAENETGTVLDGAALKQTSLMKGKAVHAGSWRTGYDTNSFVSSILISMYGKCGSIVDAEIAFASLPECNVVVYNAMLAAYALQAQARMTFDLYEQMWIAGLRPDFRTISVMLQACSQIAEDEPPSADSQAIKTRSLGMGKTLHAAAWKMGFESHVLVGSSLITMYAKSRSLEDAKHVFYQLSRSGVGEWNSMLAAYTTLGQMQDSLQLFEEMQEGGISPNEQTFVTVLQACGMLAEKDKDDSASAQRNKFDALGKGRILHTGAWRKGFNSTVLVGNSLISMYGRCGSSLDARNVFDKLFQHDAVSWNAMLTTYVKQGEAVKALQMYEQMSVQGWSPDLRTFVSVLQACSVLADKEDSVHIDGVSVKVRAMEMGKAIHAVIGRRDSKLDIFLGSALVSMYGKCGSFVDSELVFGELLHQNVVTWNAMLAAYVQLGQAEKAMMLYTQMLRKGFCPTERTFVLVLQACAYAAQKQTDLGVGGLVATNISFEDDIFTHANAQGSTSEVNASVSSTLIDMYRKSESSTDAQNALNGVCEQSEAPSTAMLPAYAEHSQVSNVLQMYCHSSQTRPVVQSFPGTFLACVTPVEKGDGVVQGGYAQVKSLGMIRTIHLDALRKGYNSDPFIASTLINAYRKCGSIYDAQMVFDGLSGGNVVTWTAMLVALVQEDQSEKAMQLYRKMQVEGVEPDNVTIVCILQACGKTGSLDLCRQVHHTVASSNTNLSPLLANTLIHAYGRCASMADAQIVFESLPQPDVMSWTALIAGYARQGNVAACLHMYQEMQRMGTKPDGVTFLSILAACCHAGLVARGVEYFDSMNRDYDITPNIEHYSSMVDLLGRAGDFTRVEHLLSTMPMKPNLAIWSSLLGACRKHGKIALGEQAFDGAVSLEPKHASAYVLMSNIYSDAGLWHLANEVKEMRHKERAWKEPGQTWIQYEDSIHTFVVGDRNIPQHQFMHGILNEIGSRVPRLLARALYADE